jgi:predicted 2-oxoglutarate/Fe(II)-dependent dioxygenase YbiX
MNTNEEFDLNYRRKFFPLPLFAHIPNVVSQNEIEDFAKTAKNIECKQAAVYLNGHGSVDLSVRKTQVRSLKPEGQIFEKVQKVFVQKSSEIWKVSSDFEYEKLNYSRYQKGDFFTWHVDGMDDGFNYRRFFTMVLFLSKSGSYTGGEFEVKNWTNQIFQIDQQPGSLLIFPSGVPHQVKEIKSGVREALVIFVRSHKNTLSKR